VVAQAGVVARVGRGERDSASPAPARRPPRARGSGRRPRGRRRRWESRARVGRDGSGEQARGRRWSQPHQRDGPCRVAWLTRKLAHRFPCRSSSQSRGAHNIAFGRENWRGGDPTLRGQNGETVRARAGVAARAALGLAPSPAP
jgi:hypothetical protein